MNQAICPACGEPTTRQETFGQMHRTCIERLLNTLEKAR
jgi:hypothetical protein